MKERLVIFPIRCPHCGGAIAQKDVEIIVSKRERGLLLGDVAVTAAVRGAATTHTTLLNLPRRL